MHSYNNTDHVNITDIECVYKLYITSKVTIDGHETCYSPTQDPSKRLSHSGLSETGGVSEGEEEEFKGKTMMSLPLKHS